MTAGRAALCALAALLACACVHAVPRGRRATKCNGYRELCNRQYSNVTVVGTHDSYAVGKLTDLGANQDVNVTMQLNDGVRALQIQGHKSKTSDGGSGISLCHTDCSIMDGGSADSYLKDVSDWLQQNANDVVTIIVANNDNLPATQWASAFRAAGLDKIAYTAKNPVPKKKWPTLQDMISQGHRVVVFMDYKTDTNAVPYILPEFKNMWEDPYDQTSQPFNCTADRFDGKTKNMMYLHNHFLDRESNIFGKKFEVPDTSKLNTTNSQNVVLSNVNKCANEHGSYPTVVLVDFYNAESGGVFKAAARMNNVKYKAKNLTMADTSSSSNGVHAHLSPAAAVLGASALALVLA
ncbi:hypothetical protein MSPP1_001255 [Malassezia sp. CBS 17886]|nr:hypothetical protein MSPP1_001255 [Malassezia sp. CBS 17886]